MAGFRIEGNTSGNVVEVDSDNNLRVVMPGYDSAGNAVGGGAANGLCAFSEVDGGTAIGYRDVLSPEVDDDYRLRISHDNLLDEEQFIDAAQNTNKFFHSFTTLTATQSTAGLLSNSGNITTTTTGMTFGTFAQFQVLGTQTLVIETVVAFSAQPNANQVVDFGPFQRGAANPYLPLDGAYFRLSSSGLRGVVNTNGVETQTAIFPLAGGAGTWTYTNNIFYKFLIQITNVKTTFWINNVKHGEILNPTGAGAPVTSRSLPWSMRHAIVGGTAGAALQATFRSYRVFLRGPQYSESFSAVGNRVLGSYAGSSGGTMGSLGTYPLNTNPTAAVPSGTALTANLPAGLGGVGLATAQAASVNDLIFGSYQVPLGTATVLGRRLVIRGVQVSCLNMGAAVATTATVIEFKLAFGHTAVSLATANSGSFATGTTKAPRFVGLGHQTWTIGSVIGQQPMQGNIDIMFLESPIYVNQGEFVALVGKFVAGTATASQTIQFMWQPIYGWE